MLAHAVALPSPVIPPEVLAFASERAISRYLPVVINLARRAFPSSALAVSLGKDAEEETHQYVALDVDAAVLSAEELLAGQCRWSEGLSQVCSSQHAVYFVLGWR